MHAVRWLIEPNAGAHGGERLEPDPDGELQRDRTTARGEPAGLTVAQSDTDGRAAVADHATEHAEATAGPQGIRDEPRRARGLRRPVHV